MFLLSSTRRGEGKWILRFVSPVTRKRRDLGLGAYPATGISVARRLGLEARTLIAEGKDPIEARRMAEVEKQTAVSDTTFREAAESAYEELRPEFRSTKHAAQWIATLQTYVFPVVGNRLVLDLRASDFAEALRPIWLSKPETASRVKRRCDVVMKWCAARDIIVASPLGVVDHLLPGQKGKRQRVEHHPAVAWRDMPSLYTKLFRESAITTGRLLLELVILTACRSGEARGMRWEEIDLDKRVWSVPASRMKAQAMPRVPLSSRAQEIVQRMASERDGSPYVFPSRRGTPLSDMTLSRIVRDANIGSETPGRTATAHSFRSTFRDWASEHSFPRDLAERALAHTVRNAVEAAYHRTDLLEQRRAMMKAWAQWIGSGSV